MRLPNLLSRAFEIFKEKEDQDKLAKTEERARELMAINELSTSDGGKALIKSLVTDFFTAVDNLIKTREDHYISDIKSIMDMINKLSVGHELDALSSYLEERIKPYGES